MAGTPAELLHYIQLLNSQSRLLVVDGFSLSFANAPAKRGTAAASESGTTLTVHAFYVSADADNAAS